MLRKHSETAAFVLLLISTAIPYGLLINTVPMPFWLTIVAAMVSGVFSAVVAAPMGRVVRQRLEDRQRVHRGQGGAR